VKQANLDISMHTQLSKQHICTCACVEKSLQVLYNNLGVHGYYFLNMALMNILIGGKP